MRLFFVLLKKGFYDLRKNFKQFISIIFIIGISVTLFVGLEANSKSFSSRVNDVFISTNVSDEWLTFTPDLNDKETMDKDLKFVSNLLGDEGEVETRFYMPTNVGSWGATGLIYDKIPTINKAYDVKKGIVNENNFFYVDKQFINRYEKSTGKTFKLGDELELGFNAKLIKEMLDKVVDNKEELNKFISNIITQSTLSDTTKKLLNYLLTNNMDMVQEIIKTSVDNYFDTDSYKISVEVNGIMSHPENISNSEFSTSHYLLSSRLLIKKIIADVASNFTPVGLKKSLEAYKAKTENEYLIYILDYLIKALDDKNAALIISTLVSYTTGEIDDTINNKKNADLEDFFNHFYNQMVMKVSPRIDKEILENEIKNYYKSKEVNNLIAVLGRENYPAVAAVQNDVEQSKKLTYAFPVLFFIVAILIVLTTISQMILKDRIQIGTLKGLGLTKGNILSYYLVFTNFIALIGALLGFILGPIIIPYVMNIKYDLLYSLPKMTFAFPWLVSLILLLIIIGLISLLTYLLIKNELGYSTVESMRVKTPSFKAKNRTTRIKNASVMMAFRNMKVHLTKSIMVVIGVMGCTGLLICGMGIDDTLDSGVAVELKNFYTSDIKVNLNSGVEKGKASEELLKIEGINDVEEYTLSSASVTSDTKSITSTFFYINIESKYFKFDKELETGAWNKKGIALSESKAKELGVKVGDEVLLEVNGTSNKYKISAIFFAFATNGVFMYKETNPDLFNISTNAWIGLKDGYNADTVKEEIIENCKTIYSVLTNKENIARIEGYMTSISEMTNTIKIFAILLAVIVLINLAILNFNERLREIATLKVLGFSRREIGASLVYEVMFLTLIGSLLGLTIGLPLEIMVLSTNETPLVSWQYTIYPLTFIYSIIISVLTALVVNIFISFKINKVSMSESLKSVE